MVGLRNSSGSHLRLVPTGLDQQEPAASQQTPAVPEHPSMNSRAQRGSLPAGLRISIRLEEVSTQVSRRLIVDSDFTLDDFHAVVQRAMGWHDMHGHSWRKIGTRFPGDFLEYAPRNRVADRRSRGQSAVAENEVHVHEVLMSPGDMIQYRYGRAGAWRHSVTLESVDDEAADKPAVCIEGVGACPPEECAGPEEFEQLLRVLLSEELRSREWTLEWAQTDFEPNKFVLEEVNERLARCVGTVARESAIASFPRTFDIWNLFELLAPASAPELHDVFAMARLDDRSESSSQIRVAVGARFQMLLTLIGDDGIDVESFLSTVDAALDQPELEPVNLPKAQRLFVLLRSWGLARKLKGRIVLTRRGRSASADADVLWNCIVHGVPVASAGPARAIELLVLLAVAAGLEPSDRHHLVAGTLGQIRSSPALVAEPAIPGKSAGTTIEVLDLVGAIGYDLVGMVSTSDMPWAQYLARAVLQR